VDIEARLPRAEMSNILQASLPPDVSLPFTVTVTERHVKPAEGRLISFHVLEPAGAWRATAKVEARRLTAAGHGGLPDDLAFASVTEIEAVSLARFA
jgi:hypothetical protein